MKHFPHLADLQAEVGRDLAVSDWITVEQPRIDQFAEATGDHQWIHVDPVRAAAGPFGATIAHGFLTLSLLPLFSASAFEIDDVRMGVNYGLNRVRFPHPVRVGSRLRGHFKLLSYEPIDGGAQLVVQVSMEIEGADKPACVAESVVAPVHLSHPQKGVRPGARPGSTMPRSRGAEGCMKVLLVDDHPLILAALQSVIQGLGDDVVVVGVDSAGAARAALAKDADYDLVLLDLGLGDADGFDVLAEFRAAYPALPVVVVSASDRTSDVIQAIDLGAMGFVPKRSSNTELFSALRMVMSGGLYVPPNMLGLTLRGSAPVEGDTVPSVMRPVAEAPLGDRARPEPHQEVPTLANVGLTPRQGEVLALLLRGLPNKLIARELNLSVETVKDHVAAVLRALGVSSRTQAVLAVSQMTQGHGGFMAYKPPTR